MSEADFKSLEKKWQKKWAEEEIFHVLDNSKKEKYYVLEMFPYPSGEGLHMGHALNYTIGDIYARFKRMQGFNVLYPMGYDALGLPAENAAIKNNTHPADYTNKSISNFIKQQKLLGLSYDWSRMVNTALPSYYKWDQWIFLKMLEKKIAYRKKAPVNWCSKCKSVLANEQVHSGKCWRHEDTGVEIKHLEQWFFKITNYADELLDKIDELNWPQRTKLMQKNWIGKSYGTEILFEIVGGNNISNVVIVHGSNSTKKESEEGVPENERHWKGWLKTKLVKRGIKVSNELYPKDWNPDYEEWKKVFEKNKINENTVLVGHSAGTAFILRWLNENKKKVNKVILVAPSIIKYGKYLQLSKLKDFEYDSSLKKYFDELIILYADNDDEDIIKSAKEINKKLGGKLINLSGKGHFTLGDMGTEEFPELLNEIISKNKKWPIFTTRPDTIFGVTFMVVSAQHPNLMELVSDSEKSMVENFLKKLKSVSEKELEETEKEGIFTGSYAINPINNEKIPVYAGNFVLADYGSGMVMAVPAHDQRDFKFAEKYSLPIKVVIEPKEFEIYERNNQISEAYTGKGDLVNSGEFNGLDNEEAKEKIIKFLAKKKLAKKVAQFKLRDWLISRQRYWGTPIPIIYCEKCGAVPVPEKELPIILPLKVSFGEGNPLATNEEWIRTKCPRCKKEARRETDTMDTFVNSSWYFLRYCDPDNSNAIFSKDKVKYWMPIDQYIGGAEHACMHLIYFRFYTKFLRDIELLNFDEPVKKLFHQGMLHGSDGQKMSKSLGNVINPLEIIEKYSADSLRLALMSFASPDSDANWDEKIIEGSYKFLKRIVEIFDKINIGKSDAKTESKLNKIIKEVTSQIENFKYNLAIIKIRELFNFLPEETSKEVLEKSLKLLHPFCPHISEELWEKVGNKNFLSLAKWPEIEEKKISDFFDKQDEALNKLISDISNILKIVQEQKKDASKIYIYVIPGEKDFYDIDELNKRVGRKIELFEVSDKKKYDPKNISKKAKPNRPAIYIE